VHKGQKTFFKDPLAALFCCYPSTTGWNRNRQNKSFLRCKHQWELLLRKKMLRSLKKSMMQRSQHFFFCSEPPSFWMHRKNVESFTSIQLIFSPKTKFIYFFFTIKVRYWVSRKIVLPISIHPCISLSSYRRGSVRPVYKLKDDVDKILPVTANVNVVLRITSLTLKGPVMWRMLSTRTITCGTKSKIVRRRMTWI